MAGKAGRSGRKGNAEEWGSKNICMAAVVEEYGSVEEGVRALLKSKEPSLLKFVFEHILGRTDSLVKLQGDVDVDGKLEIIVKYAEKEPDASETA